jgi:uncharacterized membrane protein
MKKRFWELDFLRGIAIILMISFHFLWNLNYFNLIEIELYEGIPGLIQLSSASLFLFLVGVILTINFNSVENYVKKFLKRGIIIFSAGIIISLITFIVFPNEFIYFGVLHLIGVSIIFSIPLIKRKEFNLILGIILLLIPSLINLNSIQIPELMILGIGTPRPALDFFPLIPWHGFVLIGIFFGNEFYSKLKPLLKFKKPEFKLISFIELLGKHSLLIYFLHQPILLIITNI